MSSKIIKKIPNVKEDITTEWISNILGKELQPSSFKSTALTGTGFLSSLIAVEFQMKDDNKLENVVVKLLPDITSEFGEIARGLVLGDRYDQMEIYMYKLIIPQLIQEVPKIQKYFCEMQFADIEFQEDAEYSSVLVLKDLKPQGYYMVHRNQDLSREHFLQGLDFLAKFHGAAYSFEKRLNSSLPSHYNWFPTWSIPSTQDPSIFTFLTAGFPKLYDLLPHISPEVYSILTGMETRAKEIFRRILSEGVEFACLIHADLWSHNILVPEEPFAPIKAIDWQTIGYTDPTYDLAIYILFCLPIDSLNEDGIVQAAKEYYENNSNLLMDVGLTQVRSWKEFKDFFLSYGLAYVFIAVCIRVSAWCANTSKEVMQNPKTEPKVKRILNLLLNMGVIDFVATL